MHIHWLCFTIRTQITSIGSGPPVIFIKQISIVGCGRNTDKSVHFFNLMVFNVNCCTVLCKIRPEEVGGRFWLLCALSLVDRCV